MTSAEADGMSFLEATQEEKVLVRKIDMWLMPTAWILLLFNYMDRSNIGNALVAGMGDDLHFDDGQDFYHAIIVFQVAYVVASLMFLWGTCAACLGAVKTTSQLLAIRFLLGLFEAGFAPAIIYLISSWYRKHEQAKRIYVFYSSAVLAGAFGGIVAGAVMSNLDGAQGIAGWRWLFIIEGGITVGLSLMAPYFLLDNPATTKRMTEEERNLALARLRVDGIRNYEEGDSVHLGPFEVLFATVTNWRTWVLAIPYMQLVGASSLAYFYPTLVSGLGYTGVTAQFMTAPIYVVALIIGLPLCWYADRVPHWRASIIGAIMAFGCLFCGLGTGIHNYTARYIFLCFINAAIWGGSPICVSYATSSMSGILPEGRAFAVGFIVAMSQLAQLYASNLFPATDAPAYLVGFGTYTALFGFGAVISLLSQFLLQRFPYKSSI
ncbi:major facilitator superfamily domain-containing protein [Aspergillus pseudoustus]|uniref:Major facilitator superfamily domain-containing protein n=1 Tax=Aspergillus pseudoustus TaxID=1810923 RepID=A0ABR4J533_9EURO